MTPSAKRISLWAAVVALCVLHFAAFDFRAQAILTDVRYFLYFAWQTAEGAVPHLDLFDNKTQLATFVGALFFSLGDWLGADPLYAIRVGFLGLAAVVGLLTFATQRELGIGGWIGGLLGLVAYFSFGLLGELPSIGNVPKLLMSLCAAAAALAIYRRRWFLAGACGALAFLDWQIGGLVGAIALGSALMFGESRKTASLRVVSGGLVGLAPFLLYYAANGALGAFYDQTIVASFFRGVTSLQGEGLSERFERIRTLIASDCPGYAWLVPLSLGGVLVAAVWLERYRGTDRMRLLAPLCAYHAGMLAFSLVDFQWHADLYLVLHSMAFLQALLWSGLALLLRDQVLAKATERTRTIATVAVLFLALLVARPASLRPELRLEVPHIDRATTLADQREAANELAQLSESRTLLLLEFSELLILMRHTNPLPLVYWNNASWSSYRESEAEGKQETLGRLLRSLDPDVFSVPHPELTVQHIGGGYSVREAASRNGVYKAYVLAR